MYKQDCDVYLDDITSRLWLCTTVWS